MSWECNSFCCSVCLCFQALADPYFIGLSNVEREPSTQAISKLEFEFERRKVTKDDVRELIYREVWPCYLKCVHFLSLWFSFFDIVVLNLFLLIKQILEYHPQMLQEYLRGGDQTSFMYPRSAGDHNL